MEFSPLPPPHHFTYVGGARRQMLILLFCCLTFFPLHNFFFIIVNFVWKEENIWSYRTLLSDMIQTRHYRTFKECELKGRQACNRDLVLSVSRPALPLCSNPDQFPHAESKTLKKSSVHICDWD